MKHIVLTGGPHAGKTTFLPHLVEQIEAKGYITKVIPEFATQLYEKRIHPSFGTISRLDFQHEIVMSYKSALDDILRNLEPSQLRKTIILSDRRIPDGLAYLDYSDYIHILSQNKLTPQKVMSDIYGVLHLESTALGIGLYDNVSNPARVGTTMDDAIELEQKTRAAYDSCIGKRIVISNTNPKTGATIDCKEKLNLSLQAISQLLK